MNHAKRLRVPVVLLATLSLGFVVYLSATINDLPPRLASHFDADGTANGWMTRSSYLTVMLVFGVGLAWAIASISLIFRWVPAGAINLPHKDYWLAPERRAETTAWLGRQLLWFACLEQCLMIGLHALSLAANRQAVPRMSNAVWLMLFAFLSITAMWLVRLLRRFGRPPASTA